MSLPKINIKFLNGLLGTIEEAEDGLVALAVTAKAVDGKFALGTAYEVRSMDDVANLGIEETDNPKMYKAVNDFYNEAEPGTKVVLYGLTSGAKMATIGEYNKTESGYLRHLITSMNGSLRAIFVGGMEPAEGDNNAEGVSSDVIDALQKMNQLAEWATTQLYAPLFIVLEGYNYKTVDKPRNITEIGDYNRVGVLVGDTVANSAGACIGTMAGRIASIPVQRNIGRVRDGALYPTTAYIGANRVENVQSEVETLHEHGFITLRKHVGLTGYYFTDDFLAVAHTDDYASVANRRVIDKAYRIVYKTMLDFLLDELELNSDGTMQAAVLKSIQQTVVNAIDKQMTANGELSSVGGSGCSCHIDETQNVVSTSKIEVTVKVRPFGYARDITVNLGFLVETE